MRYETMIGLVAVLKNTCNLIFYCKIGKENNIEPPYPYIYMQVKTKETALERFKIELKDGLM